jgi:hypothetical protein
VTTPSGTSNGETFTYGRRRCLEKGESHTPVAACAPCWPSSAESICR